MYTFRCKDCQRISYSASADARAPCVYCGLGTVEKLDAWPAVHEGRTASQNSARRVPEPQKAATNS